MATARGKQPKVGDHVGGYRLERRLGRGAMGIVFAARHEDTGQRVAIKMMNPDETADERAVQRFLREARTAGALDNPHVARVYEQGKLRDGTLYTVMELLDGAPLSMVIRARAPMPIDEAVGLLVQACAGLGAAHDCGVVHRDIKPSNMFVVKGEEGPLLKILDFGISKTTARFNANREITALTATGSMLGSPHYMAPEQLKDARAADARTDIWALGSVLFKMLTGELAFPAKSASEYFAAILMESPRRLRSLRPEAPAELERAIQRCLERDPAARHASAAALAADLKAAVAGAPRSTKSGTLLLDDDAAPPSRPSAVSAATPPSRDLDAPRPSDDEPSETAAPDSAEAESAPPWRSGSQRRSLGLGLLTGLALTAVLWIGRKAIDGASAEPAPKVAAGATSPARVDSKTAAATAYLERAKAYAREGDIHEAHAILVAIPEGSPAREHPDYTRLEDAWADAMFAKAESASTAEEKIRILNQISDTTSVSHDKRGEAADAALAIDTETKEGAGGTGGSGGAAGQDPIHPTKLGLMKKMQAGTASQPELRMLMALCNIDGDKHCRNAAFAKWKAANDAERNGPRREGELGD